MALTWITNPVRTSDYFGPLGSVQRVYFFRRRLLCGMTPAARLLLAPAFLRWNVRSGAARFAQANSDRLFPAFYLFLPPDFSCPCLYSCMVFCIFLRTVRFDFGPDAEDLRLCEPELFDPLLLFVATTQPSLLWRQVGPNLFQAEVTAMSKAL